jgi:hypothetical protein
VWHQAKREIKTVLIARAKARDVISYKELVGQVTALQLEPHSFALSIMLREIAAEEHAAGRGMLTAVVAVQPGPGFSDLAGRLGKNTDDELRCWIKELQRVYNCWSQARGQGNAPAPAGQASLRYRLM